MAGYAHPESLVDTAWLAKHLNDLELGFIQGLVVGAVATCHCVVRPCTGDGIGERRVTGHIAHARVIGLYEARFQQCFGNR